jgi:hypothetical protein
VRQAPAEDTGGADCANHGREGQVRTGVTSLVIRTILVNRHPVVPAQRSKNLTVSSVLERDFIDEVERSVSIECHCGGIGSRNYVYLEFQAPKPASWLKSVVGHLDGGCDLSLCLVIVRVFSFENSGREWPRGNSDGLLCRGGSSNH